VDVTVAVGTFGDESWRALAQERAVPSAIAQGEGLKVIHRHEETLAEARNAALEAVVSEWVVFLDADDELEPGYLVAMARGTADVRSPIARYVHDGGRQRLWQPRVAGHHHDCEAACLPAGNWLLVGAAARTELLREVGGWEAWEVYEDWALWLRAWQAGATFELIPDAVYRAHVRPDSRNRGPSIEEKNRVHHQIVEAILS